MKKVIYTIETDRFGYGEGEIDFVLPTVCLHIGYECNAKCWYCFAPTDVCGEWKYSVGQFVEKLSRLNVLRLVISGGEPFLYDEKLKELLRECRKRGIVTFISSNGTLLEEKIDEELESLIDWVDVSIPATNRETYFVMRGIDAFEKVKAGISRLRQKGKRVRLTYTVCKENFEGIADLPALVKKTGVNNVRIGYVFNGDGRIEEAFNCKEVIHSLENAGVTVYEPLSEDLLKCYNDGYLIVRPNGNLYMKMPCAENYICNVVQEEAMDVRLKLRERIALQCKLFCGEQ